MSSSYALSLNFVYIKKPIELGSALSGILEILSLLVQLQDRLAKCQTEQIA